jgi:hypothetical protein
MFKVSPVNVERKRLGNLHFHAVGYFCLYCIEVIECT